MTPDEVRLIDEKIRSRIGELETELRCAYANCDAWMERDQYVFSATGSAIKMSREQKFQHLLASISMWGSD